MKTRSNPLILGVALVGFAVVVPAALAHPPSKGPPGHSHPFKKRETKRTDQSAVSDAGQRSASDATKAKKTIGLMVDKEPSKKRLRYRRKRGGSFTYVR